MDNKSFEQFAKKPRTNYLENPEKYTGENHIVFLLKMALVLVILIPLILLAFFAFIGWQTNTPKATTIKVLWEMAPGVFVVGLGMYVVAAIVTTAAHLYEKHCARRD